MWVSQNPPKLDYFCTETHGDLGIPYFKKPPYVSICWSLVISFLARLPPLCIYRTAKINMFVQVWACLWIFGKWAPTNSLGKLQLERFPSSALWFCLSVPTSWKLFPTSCLEAQVFLGRLWGYRWHWNTYLRYVYIKWCQYARAPTYLPTCLPACLPAYLPTYLTTPRLLAAPACEGPQIEVLVRAPRRRGAKNLTIQGRELLATQDLHVIIHV